MPQVASPVKASSIAQKLQHGESPLDFIRKNLRSAGAVEVPRAEEPPPEPAASEVKAEAAPESAPESSDEISYDLHPEDKEAPAKEAAKEPAEEVVTDKEENFKLLRKKLGETTSELKAKDKVTKELEERVKKYETGAELPDVLKQKDAEIERLSRFEKLVSLKTSPAYKEAYIKPLEAAKESLKKIAEDYAIPEAVLEEAETFTNVKDLNQFLLNHFDEVGVRDVKDIISKIQTIKSSATEAEKEPLDALAELEKSYEQVETQRKIQATSRIIETSKDAWVDSLLHIKREGKIQELIHKDNDPEYNKTIVEPILQQASSEYGRLVRMLVDGGMEKLPKDVAFALARLVHLAHVSAISIEERRKGREELEEIKETAERTTRYTRPALGSSMGGAGGGAEIEAPRPKSPREAAQAILSKVIRK